MSREQLNHRESAVGVELSLIQGGMSPRNLSVDLFVDKKDEKIEKIFCDKRKAV